MTRPSLTTLLAGFVLALGTASSAGAASHACVKGVPKSQAYCRIATNGASERTTALLTAYSSFKPDWPLNVNPATGARKWPLVNSLGQTIAFIQQDWNAAAPGLNKTTRWSLFEADGKTLVETRTLASKSARDDPTAPYLAIQGYACMLQASDRSFPIVVLEHGSFGDHGRYIGFRGFISPAAFPKKPILNPRAAEYARHTSRGGPLKGKAVPQALAALHARTGCNQHALGFRDPSRPATASFSGNLLDPQFAWFYRYNAEFPGAPRRASRSSFGSGSRSIESNPFDNRYANYATFPPPAIDAPGGPPATLGSRLAEGAPDAQARIEADTTMIHGGGIVRAILPPTSHYVVKDWFGYADPNGFCGRTTNPTFTARAGVAQWVLIAIPGTPLEGWVPHKVPDARYDGTGCGT